MTRLLTLPPAQLKGEFDLVFFRKKLDTHSAVPLRRNVHLNHNYRSYPILIPPSQLTVSKEMRLLILAYSSTALIIRELR